MLGKRRIESVRHDDPILEIPWEKLSEIGSESSLGLSLKNSLNRFLKTFGETSLLDDLYQSVLHGLDNLDGSGAFLGFLTHPDVSYRGKSPQSIQNKLARNKVSPVKRPLEKVFNDLIGIRIIVSDYSIWEGIRARFVSSKVTVVDLRQGKIPDDGYRAVHLYFQSDHRHYPVELQFVSEHDNVFNAWQHDHFYKLSSYNPVIGKQLRDMYERGILETEDDYISALKELQSSTVFEEREVVYGTKLVASRFGMKGCIGYMPSTHQELMTLYRELFWKCVREELDVGISVVKGDGYAEFRPCTIYSTYADFYDAIFHDLLRRPRQ